MLQKDRERPIYEQKLREIGDLQQKISPKERELREQIKKMEYEKVEMRHNLIALKEAHDPKAGLNAGDMENPDMKKLL